jgi:hypothetical protein
VFLTRHGILEAHLRLKVINSWEMVGFADIHLLAFYSAVPRGATDYFRELTEAECLRDIPRIHCAGPSAHWSLSKHFDWRPNGEDPKHDPDAYAGLCISFTRTDAQCGMDDTQVIKNEGFVCTLKSWWLGVLPIETLRKFNLIILHKK